MAVGRPQSLRPYLDYLPSIQLSEEFRHLIFMFRFLQMKKARNGAHGSSVIFHFQNWAQILIQLTQSRQTSGTCASMVIAMKPSSATGWKQLFTRMEILKKNCNYSGPLSE